MLIRLILSLFFLFISLSFTLTPFSLLSLPVSPCLSLSLIRTDSSTAIVKPLHANTWRDSSEDEPPHTFPNPWTVAIGTCCCQFYCPSFFLSFFLISILLLTEVFSFHSLLSHCTALPFLLYCTVCFIDIIYSPVSLSICMPSWQLIEY